MIPRPVVAHYRRVQRLHAGAQVQAGRAWGGVDPNFIGESWAGLVPALARLVTGAQLAAAVSGASYSGETMAAQGIYTAPSGFVDPRAFAGVTGRGASVEAALYSVAPTVKTLIGEGVPVDTAMGRGRVMARRLSQTLVADAGRLAASVDGFVRPSTVWVRMLNPPSCDRCVILAGRVYRNNEGFLRHPGCDCVHVVTSRAAAESEGLISDPYQYFHSLSEGEQNRIFGKAAAEAVRDGADMFQVVNARRGVTYAGESRDGTRRGQKRSGTTTAGVGRDGYFRSIREQGQKRLTVDEIYHRKLPREQTMLLLRSNGYLLEQGQVAEGAIRGQRVTADPVFMPAAQKRLQRARLQYEAALAGRNPFGRGKATPDVLAKAEKNYRRWLYSSGQIYTN